MEINSTQPSASFVPKELFAKVIPIELLTLKVQLALNSLLLFLRVLGLCLQLLIIVSILIIGHLLDSGIHM